jgi:nucleoside-diphosphate-sugar epimerase
MTGRAPLVPATGYGRAKRALFDLIAGTPTLELSVGWARIFFAFGPHDKPDRLLSQVIDGVAAGRPVSCSAGTQVRPFIHVDDVAGALVALLRSPVEGAVNIALAQTMSVRELALCAGAAAGDPGLIAFGTQALQPGEPPVLTAAVSRLSDEVGFVPRHDIASGVAHSVAERLR